LYIGPKVSHITEVLDPLPSTCWDWTRHGESDSVVDAIRSRFAGTVGASAGASVPTRSPYSKAYVLPRLADLIAPS
jgi:hypothetical protein